MSFEYGLASLAGADHGSQWLFTEAELANSPSIQEGQPQEQERLMRAKGARFIFDVGCELGLPQYTIAVACTFMHRYFMRNSFVGHNYFVRPPAVDWNLLGKSQND
jgi:hypothetical protein